jgi:hypothetical protein
MAMRQMLALADDNRVHFEGLDCILRYGEIWRCNASACLQALGINPSKNSRPNDWKAS